MFGIFGRSHRRTFMQRVMLWASGLALLGVAIGVLMFATLQSWAPLFIRIAFSDWIEQDLANIDASVIEDYKPKVMTRMHAGDGALIFEISDEKRVFVPYENIPPVIVQAFVSAEDKNFFDHGGVDYYGVAKAQLRNLINCVTGRCTKHGGSSITQQVSKNFFLSPEQSLRRKFVEMELSHRIEDFRTKEDIMELYLNEIFLGRRSYGVAAAALFYFDRSLDELSLSQVAYLAALPKAPSTLDITRPDRRARAEARRNYVLSRMVINGYITEEQAAPAREESLIPVDRNTDPRFRAAGFFVEQVRREVEEIFGREDLYNGGLSIRTTLDTEMQRQARSALRWGLESYDRRHGYRGPLAQMSVDDNWAEQLADIPLPGAVDNWSLAIVLELADDGVIVGLPDGDAGQIEFVSDIDPRTADIDRDVDGDGVLEDPIPVETTPMNWARKFIPPDTSVVAAPSKKGPVLTAPGDVLSVGDVVLVEALDVEARTFALRQIPQVNGAILAMDPHTGRVLAMVGGYYFQFGASELNRTLQAKRQPGSSFKPFVYAAAFENGWTPADTENAGPYAEEVENKDGEWYLPKEYLAGLGSFRGEMTLRRGVEKSKNTLSIRVARAIGYNKMIELAEAMGVYDNLRPYAANALGAQETTIWRMVTAYAMFVNGGKQVVPTILDRVQNREGDTVYVHDPRDCGRACVVRDWAYAAPPNLPDDRESVISEASAYQTVSVLEGVIQRGTGTKLKVIGRPVAGKTGTTNDFRDAWFVGFAPDLAVGVYVGFDTPRSMGSGESGGRVAAPIFSRFMQDALPGLANVPFRTPPSVALVTIDGETGLLAPPRRDGGPQDQPYMVGDDCMVRPIKEAFKIGTAPTTYACTGRSVADTEIYFESGVEEAPTDRRSLLGRISGLGIATVEDPDGAGDGTSSEDDEVSNVY